MPKPQIATSGAATAAAEAKQKILISIFQQGLHELVSAGISLRAGNTGTALVVALPDYRLCQQCNNIVAQADMATPTICQQCSASKTINLSAHSPDIPA